MLAVGDLSRQEPGDHNIGRKLLQVAQSLQVDMILTRRPASAIQADEIGTSS